MRVISAKLLRRFWEEHLEAREPLNRWLRIAKLAKWNNFAALKGDFPAADVYGKYLIFDIGGNKYRLIAAVHYNTGRVYIRHVLTHAQYVRGKWKE